MKDRGRQRETGRGKEIKRGRVRYERKGQVMILWQRERERERVGGRLRETGIVKDTGADRKRQGHAKMQA